MRIRSIVAMTALLLALVGASVSAGTVTGASGLITLATADALPGGTAELAVRESDNRLGVSMVWGPGGGVEVGVNTIKEGPFGVGFLLKGVVAYETVSSPGVAVGFETERSYLVVSKRLTPRVRLHGAYLHGEEQGLAAGLAYSVSTASLSSTGMMSPATTLLAEYTPSGVNVGARMLFGPLLALDVALMDLKRPSGGLSLRITF